MAFEDGVFATFTDELLPNKSRTKKTGSPQFDETLMVTIRVPNQTDYAYRPATDADKKRFPKSYEAYLTGKEATDDGTPIRMWPGITGNEITMLDALQIKTVEQLAELPDAGIHRLGPGGMGLKLRAQKFLASQDEKDQKIAELESRIKQLEGNGAKPRKRLKVATK